MRTCVKSQSCMVACWCFVAGKVINENLRANLRAFYLILVLLMIFVWLGASVHYVESNNYLSPTSSLPL